MDQLERQKSVDTLRQGSPQQEDIEEKTSLASHSNASVASMKSKSSRVSVASSKSSVHSRKSVASKSSSSSSKSSRTSLPNLQSSTSIEPETADADIQYNYEDDNFEEPEEVDSEKVEESKQRPAVEQLEDTDPELREEKELGDSDPTKELNTEDHAHQTEQQSDSIDPALGEEYHDIKPNNVTDMGHSAESNYEDDKFEDTNPEETDKPEQQPKKLTEDTNPVTPPSPSESAEGSEETAREISSPVESSEERESKVENRTAESTDDIETKDMVTTDSYNAEVKVPRCQSSSDDTNTDEMINPESDKEAPNIKELHASKAGSEEVKEDGGGGQNQASVIADNTQDAQIDQADVSKEPQGILLNSSRRKSAGLSVSFEAGSESPKGGKQQGAQSEQQPAKDLSAYLTIEEAKKMLQKSQSTASLGSLLNEKESTPAESELDLSGSEDEDIPDLERKISDLIDGDSSQTENKTESHKNAEAGEGEKELVDGATSEVKIDSQKSAIPQPVSESEKETDGADDRSELQESSEAAATLPLSEKEMDGAEEKSELLEEGTETAMVPGNKKETAEDAETAIVLENEKGSFEQIGEEMKSEDQDKIPTSSQTGISKEVANQDVMIENQGSADTAQAETPKQVPDEAAPVDIPPTNSQTETAKEAEPSEEDTTNQEAKAGTSAEEERAREGEPELGSVAAESADINDVGSVKSGLSSSSKSSLTSVSSQGSQKS